MGRRRIVFSVLAASGLLVSVFASATARADAGAAASTHMFSPSEQATAASHWTAGAMSSATGVGPIGARASASTAPPPGIPNPTYFSGVPTVGALFFTTGAQNHFCTASVVRSASHNLALTAAHCVAFRNGVYAQNVVYVPEWHNGVAPYGAWPVASITVTSAWESSRDINDDFAFLTVTPPAGQSQPVELVTGGLILGAFTGYAHPVLHVIGLNNTDSQPIICATSSFYAMASQEEFYCNNYNDGTSGGPWILDLDPVNGTGIVVGDIGGYEEGGNYPWASYSSYYDATIVSLYHSTQTR